MSTNTQNGGAPGAGAVKVSGRGALVNFEIDDSVPLETACRELREHLGRFRGLYARGEVALNVGRRMLAEEQKARLRKVVESESGLSVRQFWCDPGILEEERERIGAMLAAQARLVRQLQGGGESPDGGVESESAAADDAPGDGDDVADEPDAAADDGAECAGPPPAQLVRDTCRSGEVRRFPGSVVILGNVNPGAQVIAGRDIMVFGALRGMAHAGADGDTDASIVAMSAVKPELQIAGYCWDAGAADASDAALVSGETRRGDRDAIIAAVDGDAVQVAPYLKNFGISRGVSYPESSPTGGSPNER